MLASFERPGLFTGTELNESEDAWKLGDYSDRWIDIYLSHRAGALPVDVEQAMLDDLASVLREHCGALDPGRPWGWKEPRSIYLLPFFHRHLPALRFLHVVRDGRDMALSANQNQLRKHGDAAPIPADLSPPERSIALWSWVNLTASRYGEEHLRDRYLRITFEDLCARPVDVVASNPRVLRALGRSGCGEPCGHGACLARALARGGARDDRGSRGAGWSGPRRAGIRTRDRLADGRTVEHRGDG